MSVFFTRQPLVLNVELAEMIGLNEAIVTQQFHYWIDRSEHVFEGRRWVYNTYTEWQKQFPWWSKRTLERIITNLEEKQILLSGNFNKVGIDRTKWYTINYDSELLRTTQMRSPVRQSDVTQHDKLSSPITREYTETNKNTSRQPKVSYAEFVEMTEEEYKKLVDQHGEPFAKKCIEVLDNYKGASGKKYKSDYRAILNWVVKDVTTKYPEVVKRPPVANEADKSRELIQRIVAGGEQDAPQRDSGTRSNWLDIEE